MSNDDQGLLGRFVQGAAEKLGLGGVQQRVTCTDCGEWVLRGDESPCGSHPQLPATNEDTFLVRIGLVKAEPPPQPIKPKKLRRRAAYDDTDDFGDDYAAPVEKRTDGGYVRGMMGGYVGLYKDDFGRKLDQKLSAGSYEPDMPTKEELLGEYGYVDDNDDDIPSLPVYTFGE
jgi:hypothetical protein